MSTFSAAQPNLLCDKSLINLFRGWPHPSLLTPNLIQSCTKRLLSNESNSSIALYYGPEEGDVRLRSEIARWLAGFYGGSYGPADEQGAVDRILISGGASQSLANILTAFTDPVLTRRIWIVAPAYVLACRSFEDAGFRGRLRAVREDAEGIDVENLLHEMEKVDQEENRNTQNEPLKHPNRSHYFRHVVYSVPTFSNPSTKTMSLSRRETLVRLARRFDALLVSDDVYDMLYWPATNNPAEPSSHLYAKALLPRLTDIDLALPYGPDLPCHEFGNTLSNGTFSKLLGPGLRTGWVEGSPASISALAETGATRSGGAPSHFTACVIAEGLVSGDVQAHVRLLRRTYAIRWRTTVDAIERLLVPLGVSLVDNVVQQERARENPVEYFAGGYFLWLQLPKGITASNMSEKCRLQNLIVAPGDMFEVPGENEKAEHIFKHMIRICFAWEDYEALTEGIERLASALEGSIKELQSV
ncbi:hypothetical protein MMC30_008703 [Trapelia coarctata]|nr:hypothetical protein [Trapelia coarctata]